MQELKNQSRITKKKKTDIGLVAHQKAPLDYISPWDGQTQPNNNNLAQSQNSDSLQIKTKTQQKSHNVVNSFLDKIRKTQSIYRKNKLSKNYSLEEKERQRQREDILLVANNNKGFAGEHRDIVKEGFREGNRESRGYRNGDNGEGWRDCIGDVKVLEDFGFGRLQYTKNIDKTITSNDDAQIKRGTAQLSKSYTFYRKPRKNNTDPPQYTQSPQQRTLNPSKLYTDHNYIIQNKNRSQIRSVHPSNTYGSRLFSKQDLNNPKQIVFIKKKKNNKNITVVDINSTAQQFYEEQIRYAEQKMITKYRRLKTREAIGKARRCQTEEGKKTAWGTRKVREDKGEFSDRKLEYPFSKEQLKKKYCFLQELKDQSIAVKIQNIMRCHPSLANTLLISK